MNIYPFYLVFSGIPPAARFPLFMDGQALDTNGADKTGSVCCAISSRSAGNMIYSETGESPVRGHFFRSLGLEPWTVRSCIQTHSRDVLFADQIRGRPRADGLVAGPLGGPVNGGGMAAENLALAVTVADCLPVFLYDTEGGAFALLHSGWRGTGIVLKALALMTGRWGTRPEAIAAALGPCICSGCYRVDAERAVAFEAEFGGPDGEYPLGRVIREWDPGENRSEKEFSLDLRAANARLLANAGVGNIAYCENCTYTDERLGSFRREGTGYTRMAAVMGRLK